MHTLALVPTANLNAKVVLRNALSSRLRARYKGFVGLRAIGALNMRSRSMRLLVITGARTQQPARRGRWRVLVAGLVLAANRNKTALQAGPRGVV
jgi:hypothetical protein